MAQRSDPPFLGTGWSFPPTFSRQTDAVIMVSDVEDIRESLWILLSTSLGERLMLAGYGSNLWTMVFAVLTTTIENEIRSIIANAILEWEPRIDVAGITVEQNDPEQGHVAINIDFVVRQTNIRSNLVYPFYLSEATLPPPPV